VEVGPAVVGEGVPIGPANADSRCPARRHGRCVCARHRALAETPEPMFDTLRTSLGYEALAMNREISPCRQLNRR
jgi:hypothetical protein